MAEEEQDDRLETVGNFLNRVDAEIACGALQAEGIEAMVAADDAAGTRPHLWLGGVRIRVHADDVERAQQILRDAENAQPPGDAADGPAEG
jgi:hypothetical protein